MPKRKFPWVAFILTLFYSLLYFGSIIASFLFLQAFFGLGIKIILPLIIVSYIGFYFYRTALSSVDYE